MAGIDNGENNLPQSGKVRQVSQKWRVYEDGAMAHHMQNEEFSYKYGLNRYNRRTVREDIPVAKVVHSEEEERLQKEHMLHLERQKAIADRDGQLARKAQQEEQKRIAIEQMSLSINQERDEEIARLAQMEEQRNYMAADRVEAEDAILATQFQTAELIDSERARVQMEMNDEQIARKLQEKEKERYERKRMERDIARQRKSLQREQAEDVGNVLVGRMENQAVPQSQGFRDMRVTDDERILRTDGKVEDAGDFSDFYIQPSDDMDPQEMKELRELQDEELARLLQDQEKKRGSSIDQGKLRKIEEKDAEIAKLIYQQEKLKVKKHKHKHSRQISEPAEHGNRGQGRGSSRSTSLPTSSQHATHDENSQNDILQQRLGRLSIDTSEDGSAGSRNTTHPQSATSQIHPPHHNQSAQYSSSAKRVRGGGPGGGGGAMGTYLAPQSQHSPASQHSSDERELPPPYRPPPPISSNPSTHYHQQQQYSQQRSANNQQQQGLYNASQVSSGSGGTPPPVPPHLHTGTPDYGEYASRPLPLTPSSQEKLDNYSRQSGNAVPYQESNTVPYEENVEAAVHDNFVQHHSNSRSSTDAQGGNVFSSLDPTVTNSASGGHSGPAVMRQSSEPPIQLPRSTRSKQSSQGSPPNAVDQIRSSDLNYTEHLAAQAAMAPSGQSPHRHDVEYADLNDMSPPAVQGHKRSSLTRGDKKKNSCKQQ